jgi:hypothetical protein
LRGGRFDENCSKRVKKKFEIFNINICKSVYYEKKLDKRLKNNWASYPCFVSWVTPFPAMTFACVNRNNKRKKHSHMKSAFTLPSSSKNTENQVFSNITNITGLDLIGARITGLDLIGARITGLDLIGA